MFWVIFLFSLIWKWTEVRLFRGESDKQKTKNRSELWKTAHEFLSIGENLEKLQRRKESDIESSSTITICCVFSFSLSEK